MKLWPADRKVRDGKMADRSRIAFIICSNNGLYYNECLWYIKNLHIPAGYETEVICITQVEDMARAYNAAMAGSDAKYKVYLHQDVFICYRQFIHDLLQIFQSHSDVGMVGMLGSDSLVEDAFLCNAWNTGGTYLCNFRTVRQVGSDQERKQDWTEVKAIDGMLMATQYDIRWREDLPMGWDFYDVSQSLEFLRRGYKIVVPFQDRPWCMHDCGRSKMARYDEARKVILEEYRDFFSGRFRCQYNLEYLPAQERIFAILKDQMEQGKFEEALAIRKRIPDKAVGVNELQYALNLLDIYADERDRKAGAESFFSDGDTWADMRDKYDTIKFIVRHAENGTNEEAVQNLVSAVERGDISTEAVRIIIKYSVLDVEAAMKQFI